MNPTFKYEIQETQTDFVDSSVISYEDNRRFVSYFGNWKIIQTIDFLLTSREEYFRQSQALYNKFVWKI